jgi:O-antigen/teichoic acid export membrane protein
VSAAQPSVARFAAVFGGANLAGLLGQVLWLALGSRAMSPAAFGTVLAAQSLYGLLQYAADNGTAFHGARLAASGALDAEARGAIARVRLELAGFGAVATLVVAAVGGRTFVEAAAPFALALGLFAVLGYWERFGLGDGAPWSAYLVLRSAGPALAAGLFLAAGRDLPVAAAGLVECAAVLAVALAFRLGPAHQLRLGLAGPRTAWREAVGVGLPNLVWQLGLFAGIVLLGASDAAVAAAALAVSVRLLTGVNQLAGVLATSLYPRLAGRSGEERALDDRALARALEAVLALALGANAVLLLVPGPILRLLLGDTSDDAERTAILTLASAGAVCLVLLLTMVLIARRGERIALPAHAAGTGLAVAAGAGVVGLSPGADSVAMAAALVAGQLVGLSLLVARARPTVPELGRRLWAAAGAAWLLAALGVVTAELPGLRAPAAVALAAAAVALLARAVPRPFARSAARRARARPERR